jgi:4,5-dihydroxyphthalate decarboxylase
MQVGRREFLKQVSVVAAVDIAGGTSRVEAQPNGQVQLKFGCGLYDRMVPLYLGKTKPEGIDLKCEIVDEPRQLFDRMGGHLEFDVAEFSSSEFITRLSRGQSPLVAIPVFPSRVFRHGFICINRRSGIRRPRDLESRRVGIELYTETAAVYIRGLLQHEYQVDLSTIHWIQGAIESPGSWGHPSAPPLLAPVALENNTSDQSLNQLLQAGKIDALIGARLPSSLDHDSDVVHLFPDFKEVEKAYYKRTRIFPIMHLVVIRRDVYERQPWIAGSLFAAFSRSKDLALERMHHFGALSYMLPWLSTYVAETEDVFGPDPWPYGLEANRATLEALVTYLADQSMIAKRIPVDELFVPVKI